MATASEDDLATDDDRWTKRPFLRRLRIWGYKSIAFCDVTLQPLTILVGRNASGKSNFLDAISFLRDLVGRSAIDAVDGHGGRGEVLHRLEGGSMLRFFADLDFQDRHGDWFSAEYDVSILIPAQSAPSIASESAHIRSSDGNSFRLNRRGEVVNWKGALWDDKPQEAATWPPELTALGFTPFSPFQDLSHHLISAQIYNFSPDAIRELSKPSSRLILDRSGRNLASVVERIGKVEPETLSRVRSYLTAIVAEVEDFRPVQYGDYLTIQFSLSQENEKPRTFDASSMSDGTLRALATLVASFQTRMRIGPSLIGIEEPESALHPASMHALVNSLDEATDSTQIILTTHSADLLEDRSISPSRVLVVQNRGGQTCITPVDSASLRIIKDELYSLSELHRQDQLQIDEADLERQTTEQVGDGGG